MSFIIFAGFTLPLLQLLGTTGLVLANCAAMISRIVFSLFFIIRYFKKHDYYHHILFQRLLPSPLVLLLFAASFVVCYYSNEKTDVEVLSAAVRHVGIGVGCLVVVVIGLWYSESGLVRDLQALRRRARGGVEEEEGDDGGGRKKER